MSQENSLTIEKIDDVNKEETILEEDENVEIPELNWNENVKVNNKGKEEDDDSDIPELNDINKVLEFKKTNQTKTPQYSNPLEDPKN